MVAGIEPLTTWPPFATTTYPLSACGNVIVTVSLFVILRVAGITWKSFESYTCTIAFGVSKLWFTTHVDELENVLLIVADCSTVIFSNLLPSPTKYDADIEPVTSIEPV